MIREIIEEITMLKQSVNEKRDSARIKWNDAVKESKTKEYDLDFIKQLEKAYDYVDGQAYELGYILDLIWEKIESK